MRPIYLLTLNDLHYAVWKDEVESVRKIETIHRLPFSPACIAGLAFIDKQSTALADLAALIGLPPFAQDSHAQLIFVNSQKKGAAFVVSGDIAEISIPDESVQPMPNYVATPEISTCVLYQGKPVPLIDLNALYQHIHSKNLNPSVPTLSVPDQGQPPTPITRTKLFTAGEEVFALPADMVGNTIAQPFDITEIPLTPSPLKGIITEGISVSPVIDLAEKMNLPNQGNKQKLLMVKIGEDSFGFLVDDELETLSENESSISPLPPLAKSSLISAAVIHHQQIIPLVDPMAIIASDTAKLDDITLADQYQPDSAFGADFNHEEIEIVEFMLLGERHALPKTEVEDTLPIATFRRVPGLQSLVIGITEYQGEILPVIDLALVFGRRSLISSDGQMVLVKNGDFRTFVITEAIHPERSLPLNIQKKVPISLPHKLIYGCYPDGNIVRLIVNVAAISIHFDKMVVKEFLSSLTKEMAATAAEIVPDLLPAEEVLRLEKEAHLSEIAEPPQPDNLAPAKSEEGEKQPEPGGTSPEELANIEPVAEIKTEELQQEDTEAIEPPDTQQIKQGEDLIALEKPAESPSTLTENEPTAGIDLPQLLVGGEQQLDEQKPDDTPENGEQLSKGWATKSDQLDEIKLPPHEAEKVEPAQDAEPSIENQLTTEQPKQVTPEKLPPQEDLASSKADEEYLKLQAEAKEEEIRRQEILQEKKRDAQALAIAKEERLKQEELNRQELAAEAEVERSRMRKILARQKQKAELLEAEEARIKLANQERVREEEERCNLEIEELNKAAAQLLERKISASEKEKIRILAEFRDGKKKSTHVNKPRLVLLSLLLLILLDIFFFSGVTQKDQPEPPSGVNVLSEEKVATKPTTPVIAPPKALTAPTKTVITPTIPVNAPPIMEEERLPVKSVVSPKPPPKKEEALAPLTIIVPDNIPLPTHTYKVQRGDTLWDISMRFTGNPYNYPFVARENDIANPDLIFPEQHILLQRKNKKQQP
ncbi:MAG: chemotaxis protein CheW [Thermodesulfobacteriota bacterium]